MAVQLAKGPYYRSRSPRGDPDCFRPGYSQYNYHWPQVRWPASEHDRYDSYRPPATHFDSEHARYASYRPQDDHHANGHDRHDLYRPHDNYPTGAHDRIDSYRPRTTYTANAHDRIDSYRPQDTYAPSEHDRYDSYRPDGACPANESNQIDSYRPQYTPQANAQPAWMSNVRDGRVAKPKPKGRGGGIAKVFVKEGEVIGAKAAPISSNSVGRRLMAKMGWLEGEALGKHGEGRLAPVEQVMRFSHTRTGIQ